jgi:hypothetical protein
MQCIFMNAIISYYIFQMPIDNTRVKSSLLTLLQNLCQLLSAHLPVLPSLEIVHTKSSVRYQEQLLRHTAYPSRVPGFTPFFEKLHVARHLNLTTMHFLIKGMILCSVLLSF